VVVFGTNGFVLATIGLYGFWMRWFIPIEVILMISYSCVTLFCGTLGTFVEHLVTDLSS
jgi:hypothetical protein